MKTFEASRLSEGNKIFPATITITDHGVTLKVPNLFSGQEKTLAYRSISSIDVNNPIIGFSDIIFLTLGHDRLKATGFSKTDADEIKELVQLGITSGVGQGGQGYSGGGGGSLSEAMVASEAARTQALVEKQRMDLEQQKYRDEKEAKDKSERLSKADEHRKAGRKYLALVYEYNVMYWGPIVLIVMLYLTYNTVSDYQKESMIEEASAINLQLENIEDQIKLAITDGDNSKALELTAKLVHPIHERWQDQDKWDGQMGYPHYDDWWSAKRQEYKDQILGAAEEAKKEKERNAEEAKAIKYYMISNQDGTEILYDRPNGDSIGQLLPSDRFEFVENQDAFGLIILADRTQGYIHLSKFIDVQ